MTQWVKALLCKHKDLSSVLRSHVKSQVWLRHASYISTGKVAIGELPGLADQPD